MATQQQIDQIYYAYKSHCDKHHNADFEVCEHPDCAEAWALEDELTERGEWPPEPEGAMQSGGEAGW